MSSVAMNDLLHGTGATVFAVEPFRRTAAKVAGFLYLFTNATAIFGFYARTRVIVSGDAAQTLTNLVLLQRLFRAGIVAELITVACVIGLVAALYVILSPVNRPLAILAAFWRLTENVILALIVLNEFVVMRLLSASFASPSSTATEFQALSRVFLGVYGDGFRLGFVFQRQRAARGLASAARR